MNKGNKKLYLPVKNKTNLSTNKNRTKVRYQLGNKEMKIKLTNILRGKERRKERKKSYAKLNRGRLRWFIYIKY